MTPTSHCSFQEKVYVDITHFDNNEIFYQCHEQQRWEHFVYIDENYPGLFEQEIEYFQSADQFSRETFPINLVSNGLSWVKQNDEIIIIKK